MLREIDWFEIGMSVLAVGVSVMLCCYMVAGA